MEKNYSNFYHDLRTLTAMQKYRAKALRIIREYYNPATSALLSEIHKTILNIDLIDIIQNVNGGDK